LYQARHIVKIANVDEGDGTCRLDFNSLQKKREKEKGIERNRKRYHDEKRL